ncbi:MAG: exosortase A [Casimicrobiaceae bacterium]
MALALVAAGLAVVLILYWPTFASIEAIWSRSETFAHGYLIAPIALYLVWARRHELATLPVGPDWLGLAMLALSGLGWLIAAAGAVQVVQQYAVVAMIPSVVVTFAGRAVGRALLFPLSFLFLGVPIGEALIPPLMDWTAEFTVAALRLTGIPVFREGTFFSIPSGNWSVVEGCSGLRYLIASITVGVLYAYLNYRSLTKRAIFVVMSIIVPIIANGLRAYMIVMIAHLSDMRLALGVDHLIYGWVFFGLVMLLLFWIGSFWRDPDRELGSQPTPAVADRHAGSVVATRGIVAFALISLVVAGIWPAYAAHIERNNTTALVAALQPPAGQGGWTQTQAFTDWRPRYEGAASSLFETYRKGNDVVAVYLGYYRNQRRGADLLSSQNIMVVQKHPVWSNLGESARSEQLASGSLQLRETMLRSPYQRLLVWDWYRVGGQDLTKPYLGKLFLARDRLLGRGDSAAAIIVTTPYQSDANQAEAVLRTFLQDMLPALNATLRDVSGETLAATR